MLNTDRMPKETLSLLVRHLCDPNGVCRVMIDTVRKPMILGCLLAASLPLSASAQQATPVRFRGRTATTQRQTQPTNVTRNAQSGRRQATATQTSTQRKNDPLVELAQRAIEKTTQRHLDADKHTPWQIMHGVVALRRDFMLSRGDSMVNCIEFISDAPQFRGEHWFQATKHGGRAHPFSVPYAFEGHANQFLALLSPSNLPLDHEFNVDGQRTVTMADMIRNAKMTVNDKEEITWTLWFLTHYIDIDSEWTNEKGEPWSMERLVQMQTRATVTNAPCGGTHGLYAIAYARNGLHPEARSVCTACTIRRIRKSTVTLNWLDRYRIGMAASRRDFYKGPGQSQDFNERIKSSGHMLEWLMMGLPQQRINEPWVRRAVASISTDLIHNASQPAECGPLYHALNSLIMYRDRVMPQPSTDVVTPELAQKFEPRKAVSRKPELDSTAVAVVPVPSAPKSSPLLTTPIDTTPAAPALSAPVLSPQRTKSNSGAPADDHSRESEGQSSTERAVGGRRQPAKSSPADHEPCSSPRSRSDSCIDAFNDC